MALYDVSLTGGEDGKSAYQYAVDAGYEGTEEEFAQLLLNENTEAEKIVYNNSVSGLSANNVQGAIDELKDTVEIKVANLVGTAPETLDTLEEVAQAIEENEDVVTALNSAIGSKANQSDLDTLQDVVDTKVSQDDLNGYMLSENPTGTGSLSINRKEDTTIGNYSIALGYETTASGSNSHAEGGYTTASGSYSHAEGDSTESIGQASHAEGYYTESQGNYSHSEGKKSIASGEASHAEGYETTASECSSHSEGNNTIASGVQSHAEGYYTIAKGENQHVQGKYNIEDTNNTYAHIVGGGTSEDDRKNIHTIDWDGNAEFAGDVTATDSEGNKVSLVDLANNPGSVSGDYLTTENPTGTGSLSMNRKADTSVGTLSSTLGNSNTANGYGSHAQGNSTTSSGTYTHTEGGFTKASGTYSHAEGFNAEVSWKYSHAEGRNTLASSENQHVQGKYNIEDTTNTYAHIVGNGTSTTDRSNAHTLDWDGNADFAGDVTATDSEGNKVSLVELSNASGSSDMSDLVVKLNGGTTEGTDMFTFNGNEAKTIDITPSSIGASASSHTHDEYLPLSGGTLTGDIKFGNSSNNYCVYSNGTARFNGLSSSDEAVLASLYVNSTATIVGTLLANGDVTMNNMLKVSGTTTLSGKTTFTKICYFANGTTYKVDANGNATFKNITQNGNTVLDTSNYTTYCAKASHTHSYLPLSGGTVTGATTFSGGITISGSSSLKHQLTLGTNTASDGNNYYINNNGTGRFNALRYTSSSAYSSRRYKDNIDYRDTEYWHNALMDMKPCTFSYKNDENSTERIGLIAEELYELIPELVVLDDEDKPSAIEYANLVVPLIAEVQRLNKRIDELEGK